MAYLEYPVGGDLVEDADVISRLAVVFDDLRDHAMSTRESAELIAHVAHEHGS